MINPISSAANFFLGILQAIPYPIKLLVLVAAGFFVIASVVRMIFH